jgi:5,10-methylenetetrahydromethanopterin reductase
MTEPVRIHIRVPGTAPMPALMTLVESIEAAGFDGAGILDSQMIGRDTFVILGQAAARTTRLALFPAVTNPFTRHASVLASAIQTVEDMAPGRIKCVIGTGYSSASTIGALASVP